MPTKEKEKTLKIKCLKSSKYGLDPAKGKIVFIKEGTVDFFPIKFAHDMVKAGSFELVDAKDIDLGEQSGDVAERLKIIAERESVLSQGQLDLGIDQEQLKVDQEQLKADREQFEADKQKFADIAGKGLDAVVDDDKTVDGETKETPKTDGPDITDGKTDGDKPSVADRCANIVKTSKNEKAAKKALVAFADNNFGLKLDKKFDSTSMTEKIIQEANAQADANNGE